MSNFWNNIGVNNTPQQQNGGFSPKDLPKVMNFINQYKNSSPQDLEKLLRDNGINATPEQIQSLVPMAKNIASLLGLKI